MFKFLDIKNFQSHKHTRIDFDSGVNVIFGLSQAGKTAIIRAARLLIYNRPLGGKFFSDFATDQGETTITLGLKGSDDVSISKSIKLNKNGDKQVTKTSYKIGLTEFSSPKDQVPDQIVNALNVSELNIQRQFDPPFLVASSGGEIASTINRITRLEEVDEWVSELTSEINAGNRDIARIEAGYKNLLDEISIYKNIDETENVVDELKSLSNEVSSLNAQHYTLDRFLVQFEEATRACEKISEFLLAERYLTKAEKFQSDIENFNLFEELILKYDALSNVIEAKNNLEEAEELLAHAQLYFVMNDLFIEYDTIIKDTDDILVDLKVSKDKYIKLISENKICPTCFEKINVKHLKNIENFL